MKEITIEDCIELQNKFYKYCETAEQHELPMLVIVDIKLTDTIRNFIKSNKTKNRSDMRAMFRVVLRLIGEDFSEYEEIEMEVINYGDKIGVVHKIVKDNITSYILIEDEIAKITHSQQYGTRYFAKSNLCPLDVTNVFSFTRKMERLSKSKGDYMITEEMFILNDVTEKYVNKWIKNQREGIKNEDN